MQPVAQTNKVFCGWQGFDIICHVHDGLGCQEWLSILFRNGLAMHYSGSKTYSQLLNSNSEKSSWLMMSRTACQKPQREQSFAISKQMLSLFFFSVPFPGTVCLKVQTGVYFELELPMRWRFLNREGWPLPTSRPVNVCSLCWGGGRRGVGNHSDPKRPKRRN